MNELQTMIQDINQRLDGVELARLINYHPDKIQVTPTQVKCFCPVHSEKAFRSLIFDLRNHTYKCMMKHCACFKGGSFVEFWALFRNIELIDAARQLAEAMQLPIDFAALRTLAATYFQQAEAALEAADLEEAQAQISEALTLDPHNIDARLLSARIWHEAGATDRALEERLALFDDLLERQELNTAARVLEETLRVHPDAAPALERQVRLARQQPAAEVLAEALIAWAEVLASEELATVVDALAEASALRPDDEVLLQRLADAQANAGDPVRHRQALERLAELQESRGELAALLLTLERIATLDPDDLTIRERIAAIQFAAGDKEQARQLWLNLAQAHVTHGRHAEALTVFERLLADNPGDLELLEQRARLLHQAGRSAEAVATLCELARQARQADESEQALAWLEQARAIDPRDIALRQLSIEWKLADGNQEEALNDLFQLADLQFECDEIEEAQAALARIAELVPADLDRRLRVGRVLERNGLEEEAYLACHALARDLMAGGRYDAAIAICEELRRLRPLEQSTLEMRLDVHLALRQKAEALEACRETARAWLAQTGPRAVEGAEAALQRGMKIDRTDSQIKIDLARLYESTARAPLASGLWLEMAVFHRAERQTAVAQQAIREALRLDPHSREARRMLAEGLEEAGQVPEAIELWRELGGELLVQTAATDAPRREALAIFHHALDLAPRDRNLLEQVTHLALELEGAEAAHPLYERWLEALADEREGALVAWREAVQHYPAETGWRTNLVTLLLQSGAESEAAEHLELLLGMYREQGVDTARQYAVLEQLVQLVSERQDLRLEQARMLGQMGRTREAAMIYQTLADSALRGGDTLQASQHLDAALALQPDDDELLTRVAELHERLGAADRALTHYERLAELRRRNSDRSRSIPVLEKLLAYDPARMELRAELAELYEHEGDLDRSIEQYFRLAQVLQTAGKEPRRVVALCGKLRQLAPEFIPARELMVEVQLQLENRGAAREELDQLGDLALADGQLERAELYFKRVQEIDPTDIGSGERLGKLYEARGRIGDALAAYTHVLELYERQGELARAVGVLQKLKGLDPNDLQLRLRLARHLLALGGGNERREAGEEWLGLIALAIEQTDLDSLESALAEAVPAFRQDWTWRARLGQRLVELQERALALETFRQLAADALAEREFDVARDAATAGLGLQTDEETLLRARAEAQRRLSNYPAAIADLRELARLASASGRPTAARDDIRQALELDPREPSLLDLLADLELAIGDNEAAGNALRRACELLRQSGQWDAALERMQRLCLLNGQDTELREQLANLYLEAERADEALAIWRSLAEESAAEGRVEAATARYARILELKPADTDVMRRLADLVYEHQGMHQAAAHYDRLIDALQAEGEADAIEAEYLRILEMEPGHLQLKERFAEFLHAQGRGEDARETWLHIVKAYRDEREEPADAVRVLRRLRGVAPDDATVREEEASLLEQLHRGDEAAGAWRQLAELHARRAEREGCARALARAAAVLPDDARAQLDAAEAWESAANPEEATACLLRAIEIHDRREDLAACVPILERAIWLNPQRFDLSDALARILERQGQLDRAAEEWLALGARHEEAEQIDAARRIYQHLRSVAPEHIDCQRRLARLARAEANTALELSETRELARLCGENGEFEEAAQCLERVLELEPQDEGALIALASLWREIELHDKLYDTLLQLERIQFVSGRHGEALTTLEELKALRPDEPDLIARSIELLIQADRLPQAAQQGIELIQIYFDRGDDTHALETLRRIAEIEPAHIERRISLARLVHSNGREAAALQEFFLSASKLFGEDMHDGALQLCQAGLQLFPDDVRLRDLMARVLRKLDRVDEAIEVQLHLAVLYDEREEESHAQQVYEAILQEQPDHLPTLEAMVDWALRHDRKATAIEHLVALAESHYLSGRLPEAISAMERIQELDDTRLELKTRLAEIYLEASDPERAVATWLDAARAWVEAGRPESALEIYERVSPLRGDDPELIAALAKAYGAAGRAEDHKREALRLAALLEERGEVEQALELFEGLADSYPQDPMPWERLAELYRSRGASIPAVRAYQRLHGLHKAARKFEQARQALESALELDPDHVELTQTLGELCLSLGRRPEALEHLARAARLLKNELQYEEARDLGQRILKLDPLNLPVRHLVAQTLEALGDTAASGEYVNVARGYADAHQNGPAIEILEHLLRLEPGRGEERELFARLLHREGRTAESIEQYIALLHGLDTEEDPRRGIKFCRLILTERPDCAEAHTWLCDTYERTDKLRQAFKECEWLAEHHLAHGDQDAAMAAMEKGLAWFPEELPLRMRQIELLIEQGRNAEAAEALQLLAPLAEARADARTTAWALARSCELQPENLEHLRRLAEFQERSGELTAARESRIKLIAALLQRNAMEEARTTAEHMLDAANEDEELRLELARLFAEAGLPEVAAYHHHHLARRALAAGRHEEARQQAQQALLLKPRHVAAREALIEALRALGENGTALEEYVTLEQIYEDSDEWDASLRTLQAMIELAPSRPEPRRKLVELYRRLHREDAMIDQLRRLVEIHVNQGEFNEAIDRLRDLMQERPDDTRARIRYIDLYMQIGDETDLRDDFLQLARIYARKGEVVEATRTYEKLLLTQPDDVICRELFVQFLFEQSQINRAVEETRLLAQHHESAHKYQEAGRVLDRALTYAPDELDLRQRLAGIYLHTNRRGLALESYRTLARHYEKLGDTDRLREVLEQIIGIDAYNVEFRQQLAELYARCGADELAYQQYEALAVQYSERGLLDLAEQELRRMLALRPGDIGLLERIAYVHQQLGGAAEASADLLRLSDAYLGEGRMKEAVAIYQRILDAEPENVDVLRRYIDAYMQIGLEQDLMNEYLRLADLHLRRGELQEALRIYKHMMELAPDSEVVRERLSATQTLVGQHAPRTATESAPPPPPSYGHITASRPHAGATPGTRNGNGFSNTNGNGNGYGQVTGNGEEPPPPPPAMPAKTPAQMRAQMTPEISPAEILKLIRNYQNVLKLNPHNAPARVKLAELYEKMSDQERADEHWALASESLFMKGDCSHCIDICERYLTRHPADSQIRDRLSRAMVQRDSMRAIDGAISKSF